MKKLMFGLSLVLLVGCGKQVDLMDIQIEVLGSGVEVIEKQGEQEEIVKEILNVRRKIMGKEEGFSSAELNGLEEEKLFWQWMGFDGFLQNSIDDAGDSFQKMNRGYVIDDDSYFLSEDEFVVTVVSALTTELKKDMDFEQKYFFVFEDMEEGWKVKDIYATKRNSFVGFEGRGTEQFSDLEKGGIILKFEEDQRKGEYYSELGRLPETIEEFMSDKWFLPMP